MQKIDLKNTPIPRLFFTYFIPSLFTMIAISTYSVVDGIFVGRKLGNEALAAIGITWPVFPLMIAVELLFSFGGATLTSYYLGKRDSDRARLIFSSVFYFLLFLSLILSLCCFLNVEKIVAFLGASQVLHQYAVDYLSIIFLGMSFILLHPLIDVFVVNDRQPFLATFSMIVGAVSNIILNYYFMFILDMGIKGSALATILAHFIGFVLIFQHFLRKKGDLYLVKQFSFLHVLRAAKSGIPQSTAEISAAIVMFLFNFYLMRISGEYGVAIYTIMMYSGIIVFTILLSVSQGLQPITSFSYGANLISRTKKAFQFSLYVAIMIGILFYAIFFFLGEYIVLLFLKSHSEKQIHFVYDVTYAIKIYYVAYIFMGVNILVAVFLQSIQSTLKSFILTLFYTIIFEIILLPILSHKFGINGIWISYPIAQFLSLFIAGIIFYFENKRLCKLENRGK